MTSTLHWPVPVKRAAVFLDRDGTLNQAYGDHPPANPSELVLLPGVADAVWRLKEAGFDLVVVTNQPDVARGTQSRDRVEAINECLRRQLPVDEIVICYHDDSDNCDCRKPKAGMLVHASLRRGLDLTRSYMVGDRRTDVAAGCAAGCTTIYLTSDHLHPEFMMPAPDFVARDLSEAAQIILSRQRAE